MRPSAAALVLGLGAACSNPQAILAPTGSSGTSSGGTVGAYTTSGVAGTGTTGTSSGTTGAQRFACNLEDGGLFDAVSSLATGLNPPPGGGWTTHPMAVGDFNGDGRLDIAIADSSSGGLGILFGNSDGTFTLAPTHPVIAVTPQDLVAVGSYLGITDFGSNTDTVTVGAVQSSGAWDVLATENPWDTSAGLLSADLNGDGNPDLLSMSRDISVFLGDGRGTFTLRADLTLISVSEAFADVSFLADINEDGFLDIAAGIFPANNDGSMSLAVFLGHGDGTFADAGIVAGEVSFPDPWLIGDLNEDGHVDLLVGHRTFVVMFGRGDGTFTPQQAVSLDVTTPHGLWDLDGDGHLDYVGTAGEDIYVALGNGDGTFRPAIKIPAGSVDRLRVGDVNSDGRPDLIVSFGNSENVGILLNNCR